MDVLGRRLADPFDAFGERYGPEIPASVEHIEEGHSPDAGTCWRRHYGPSTGPWTFVKEPFWPPT